MIINLAQSIVAILLVVLILLQERSSGLSGLFAGTETSGGFYHARRGLEKLIFRGTIALAVLFVALSVAQLLA
jgi:protein translocase SecG subunit